MKLYLKIVIRQLYVSWKVGVSCCPRQGPLWRPSRRCWLVAHRILLTAKYTMFLGLILQAQHHRADIRIPHILMSNMRPTVLYMQQCWEPAVLRLLSFRHSPQRWNLVHYRYNYNNLQTNFNHRELHHLSSHEHANKHILYLPQSQVLRTCAVQTQAASLGPSAVYKGYDPTAIKQILSVTF